MDTTACPDWRQTTPLSLMNYKHTSIPTAMAVDAADTLVSLELGAGSRREGAAGRIWSSPTAPALCCTLSLIPLLVTDPPFFDVILGDAIGAGRKYTGWLFAIVYDAAAVRPGGVP